jgi:hypothetical protein
MFRWLVRCSVGCYRHAEENLNLPLCPIQPSELWRANARVSVGLHLSLVWGDKDSGLEGDEAFVSFTRVVEKGAMWTILVMEQTLAKLAALHLLPRGTTVVLWSDTGPSYRAARFLGTVGLRWAYEFNLKFVVNFGLEHHAKNRCDGWFGNIKTAIRDRARAVTIASPSDALEALRRRYPEDDRVGPRRTRLHLDEIVPSVEKSKMEDVLPTIRPDSLPLPVRACHSYSFTPNDERRSDWHGADKVTMTGMTCRGHRLPNRKSAVHLTGFLQLASEKEKIACKAEEEVAAKAEEDISPVLGEVDESKKMIFGWRCTYRIVTPELPDLAKTIANLTKKAERFDDMAMPEGTRRMQL